MNRWNLVCSVPFVVACGLGAPLARAGNVLLVVGDDTGIDKLDRSATTRTPRLAGLAGAGVSFTHVWSNPLCSPTRATIQTGRYSFRTGVGTVLPVAPTLPLSEFTIPEALTEGSSGSIASGAFGKWHLSRTTASGVEHPLDQGYAWYQGVIAGAVTDYFHWPKSENGSYPPATRDAYATTDNVDDALAWISDQDGEWFCYLAFNAAHSPLHAPPSDLYTGPTLSGDPCDAPLAHYTAMFEALDTELGRLLDTLPAATLAETTVIFVGDNGTPAAVTSSPDPLHSKGSLYQGGIVVPLIISGAGVSASGDCSALVNTSDLFATVVELFGYAVGDVMPDGRPVDSVSLVPYLANPAAASARNFVYSELFLPAGVTDPGEGDVCGVSGELTYGEAVRNARYKLIRFSDGSEEFYDLSVDADEADDLLTHAMIPPPGNANLALLRARLNSLGI